MKLFKIARRALMLGKTQRSDKMYFLKKISACKKAALCGNYEEAYYKLLDAFEDHLSSFGNIMRGNSASSDGSGPHFRMIWGIPEEALRADKKAFWAIVGMYNLYRTNFPSVPANYIARNYRYWSNDIPGDTSYFYLWLDDNHRYLGEMRPIDSEEYMAVTATESYIKFADGCSYYNQVRIDYKVVTKANDYPVVYLTIVPDNDHLDEKKHYYKYCWQF